MAGKEAVEKGSNLMFQIEEEDYKEPEIELVHQRFYSGEELDGDGT